VEGGALGRRRKRGRARDAPLAPDVGPHDWGEENQPCTEPGSRTYSDRTL